MRLLFAFFDLDALVLWSNCGDHDWSRSRFRASTRTPGPRPRVKAEPFRCRLRPRTRMLRSAGMALRAVSFLRPDWGLPSKGFGPRVPLRSTHGLLSCAASRLNIRTGSTGLWREPARFLVALLTCRPVTCVRALNLGGPSGPIVPTNDSSPNGSPQRGALQTFLQTWKSGSSSLAPQPAPRWLMVPGTVPLSCLKSACGGSPTKAESNSHCLGRETVALIRWIFPPVCSYCTPCVKRDLGHSR